MFFQRIFTPSLAINSYLLGDEKTKQCVVVDPTRHVTPYIVQAQNAGLDITHILETHVHADFVSGSKELKHQLNGKPRIYASGMGGERWIPAYADEIVQQGTEVIIGDVRLVALHTPGHTPEHISWLCYDHSRSATIPWFALTGDCLFVGSVGRPDLLGKDEMSVLAYQLYQTLFDVFGSLPDCMEILPTHSAGSFCGKSLSARATSTLGYERLFNPYLKKGSFEKWWDHMQEGLSPIPPYFKRLKKVNLSGAPLLNSLKVTDWNQTSDLGQLFLVDIRHPEVFAASHLHGALNIPYSATFTHWLGWMVPEKKPIGLIVENKHAISEVIDQFRLIGLDQEISIIELQENQPKLVYPSHSFSMIEVEELAKHEPHVAPFYLIDVRTQEEWQTGHILGAHHVELTHLQNNLHLLPHDRTLSLICRSGHRASLAASLLEKHGFKSVMNVRGGMQAWRQAGLPMVKD